MTAFVKYGGAALAMSGLLAPVVLAVLRRGQVLDHPTERSSHTSPVPRGGGLAVAVGALTALAFTSAAEANFGVVALAAALFGLLGLLEDVIGIRPLHRLAIQFSVAGVSGMFLLGPGSGPEVLSTALAASVVAVWLVAFVNAYNFMDGINGISVAQAVGAGASWLVLGELAGSTVLTVGGAIIGGAALGFAPFNMPHARMFLGDVGSYFIGAWLAAVAVLALRSGVPPEAVLGPLVIYVADTGITLARRVLRGEVWYLPHRGHTYQRLGDAGWSHMQVSSLVAACIVMCGALGAASLGSSLQARIAADSAAFVLVAGYLISPFWITRSRATAAVLLED